MCAALGKLPHELAACTEEEWDYLKSAWNAINAKE